MQHLSPSDTIRVADTEMPVMRFINELATTIAIRIVKLNNSPENIPQAKAYREFGRKNVEAWLLSGAIEPRRTSTGRVYYNYSQLLSLSEGCGGYMR